MHTTHTCFSSCPTCQRYDDKHVWSAIIIHVLSSFTQHQKIFRYSIKTTDDSQKHFSVGLQSSPTQRCSYTFWPLEGSVWQYSKGHGLVTLAQQPEHWNQDKRKGLGSRKCSHWLSDSQVNRDSFRKHRYVWEQTQKPTGFSLHSNVL